MFRNVEATFVSFRSPTLLVSLADTARARALRKALAGAGVSAATCTTAEAPEALASESVTVVVLDWDGGPGSALARAVVQRFPDVPVIALAVEETSIIVDAMRAGVWDVVPGSAEPDAVLAAVQRVLAAAAEQPAPTMTPHVTGMFGESAPMQRVHDLIRRAAPGATTVLVRGESGTGKELVARALHALSPRAAGPFVKVHCAALPETLLESELFGYEKGAFTGATARKPGRVEVAEEGTLFLDEIGDITLSTQVKLLRVLQDREYERLGSTETRRANVRFIAATHRNLEKMVKEGLFREDLFYRMNVVPIWVPPLRMRHGDIELLAPHFCAEIGAANGRPRVRLATDALQVLLAQRWPGNVRQLQNFIERLVVLSDGEVITASDVERELSLGEPFPTLATKTPNPTGPDARSAPPAPGADTTATPLLPLTEEVARAEKKALERALRHAKGNRVLAARLLGVGRATLYRKMQEYGVC
jgi:two-component system, NtrC family, response regulator AtoC